MTLRPVAASTLYLYKQDKCHGAFTGNYSHRPRGCPGNTWENNAFETRGINAAGRLPPKSVAHQRYSWGGGFAPRDYLPGLEGSASRSRGQDALLA